MNNPLTPREAKALEFIAKQLRDYNISPSLREIAIGIGLSYSSAATVHYIVQRLERKGYVRRMLGKHRSIEVVPQGRSIDLSPEASRMVELYSAEHEVPQSVAACELIRFGFGSA